MFTFQGRLGSAGAPAEGSHDFVFRLFDAQSNGAQIGSELARPGVAVIEGVFTAQLDFGDGPFEGSPRWLEIDVRESGTGAYTTLDTRFRIGSAPFAIEALAIAPGAVDTAALQDGAVTQAKLAIDSVGSAQIASGAVRSAEIFDGSIVAADIADQAVSRSRIKPDAVGSEQVEDNSIVSGDIQNGTIQAVDVGNGAIGSAQIQNQSIGAIDLASGSVGSDEIIDGTITPDDISGGLYARKGQVQFYRTSRVVNTGTVSATTSCADGNDIPVIALCNPTVDQSTLTVLSKRLTSFENDVNPVRLHCVAENRTPAIGATLEAVLGCIPVP
ncbi:MAG: hypothetical protein V2J10_12395 [Wenzhouxiangella sp.]|nr:hypothetical protein [Wenzhouxiangella sp.]